MVKLEKGSSTVIMNTCFMNNTLIKSIDCKNVPFLWIDEENDYWYHNNGYLAFAGCSNLVSVSNINNNTINMDNMFLDCSSLTTIDKLPNSVIYLNDTFDGCFALTTPPEIPATVEEMGGTFYTCDNLTSAPIIPENVVWMQRTFYGCEKLTGDIYISAENVENAFECFKYCGDLPKYVHVPKDSLTYQSFVDAGYKDDGSVEGVYLINGEVEQKTLTLIVSPGNAEVKVGTKLGFDLTNFTIGPGQSGFDQEECIFIDGYTGTDTDVVIPTLEPYDEEE